MNELTHCVLETLREDTEFAVARAHRLSGLPSWLVVSPVHDQPTPASVAKLAHAFALRSELDAAWAARPLELMTSGGRPALVIEDPGGQFLDQLIVGPLAVPDFLRIAIGIAKALGCLHARGLVHRDVKPANLIVKAELGEAWLTGFGLTSRLPRRRQPPVPAETIAGTLAYMAPEQTGRMNRSVDSRSDLYSFGVTLYEMVTGSLPFVARDPMEWVHCHTARRPPSPSERFSSVPATVSAIIMKLLAKGAEDRYQSAAGAESDLRRCLSEWEATRRISDFALGEHDNPDRLLIPEKLYGRDREIGTLLSAFDRVVAGGRPELVLVSGYSGIGKSALVNELHKPLVPPRGLFASGKFDQYKRDIPYTTLAQAFQSLIRPLLRKSDEELGKWREALQAALEPNGALVVELVPELLHIIGKQPPVPELPPRDAQARFHLVLMRNGGAGGAGGVGGAGGGGTGNAGAATHGGAGGASAGGASAGGASTGGASTGGVSFAGSAGTGEPGTSGATNSSAGAPATASAGSSSSATGDAPSNLDQSSSCSLSRPGSGGSNGLAFLGLLPALLLARRVRRPLALSARRCPLVAHRNRCNSARAAGRVGSKWAGRRRSRSCLGSWYC